MFVESLIISKPLFPCSGAVLIEVRAPSSKARQHWPFAGQFLCIYYHRKRSTEKQSWFCQQLWWPFTLSGHTFSIREGTVLPAWRPALPPPRPLTGHMLASSLAPQRKSTAFKSYAPCLCQSLTSSLPSLASGRSKPHQLKKWSKTSLLARASWRSRRCRFGVW